MGFLLLSDCAPEGNEDQRVNTDLCVWFAVYFNFEVSFVSSVYRSIQESQTVSSNIFLYKLDVAVHSIDAVCEDLHFLCFDFDPGVSHIP